MAQQATTEQKPISKLWYKNYMVWIFVIGLPVFVVVACIWFVYYSIQIKDSVVRDDWYMDGKTLYADVSKDKLAYDLGLAGTLKIQNNQVTFDFQPSQQPDFKLPETLNVEISHATQISKDRDFIVKRTNNYQYTGTVELNPDKGKYYIIVHNPENSWRLRTVVNLPNNQPLVFKPLTSFKESD